MLPGQPWVTAAPLTGVAPGRNAGSVPFRWAINTDGMLLGATYATKINIEKTDPNQTVDNSPLTIPVSVTVKAPPYTAVPNEVYLYDNSCDDAPTSTLVFYVLGAPGSRLETRPRQRGEADRRGRPGRRGGRHRHHHRAHHDYVHVHGALDHLGAGVDGHDSHHLDPDGKPDPAHCGLPGRTALSDCTKRPGGG